MITLNELYLINNSWQPETVLSIGFIDEPTYPFSAICESALPVYGGYRVAYFINNIVGLERIKC